MSSPIIRGYPFPVASRLGPPLHKLVTSGLLPRLPNPGYNNLTEAPYHDPTWLDLGLFGFTDPSRIHPLGYFPAGRRGSGLSRRSASKGCGSAAPPRQRTALGRECAVCFPGSCLRIGGQDSQRDLSAAMLLLLRPRNGTQEPAQLL